MARTRGRPRQFDEQEARQAILHVFWEKGFSATSLDDLSKATGMVRPSLYGAFGSKVDMYLMSMDVFLEGLADVRGKLAVATDPQGAVESFLLGMIDAYFDDENGKQFGCFLVGTAIAEAPSYPEIRTALTDRLNRLNSLLYAALERLAPDTPADRIQFAAEQSAATMHSIAVRARSGEARDALTDFARRTALFVSTLLEQ